jgi:methyl-accepting chemotaxis protein
MNVAALKESFALIAPRKEEFAHSFYQRLFSMYPQTQQLFAHTDMKQQESSLVATLAVVVAGVERGDDLTPVLQKLGAKHKTYNALPDHYPLVGGVLLDTFKEYLGSVFTPEVQETWTEAYGIISAQMLIGAGEQVA